MICARQSMERGNSGFTLIETLAALALMGLILSVLATITSQWLPSWNRGFERIQRSESLSIALERISEDIGASEFIKPNREAKHVLFRGSELSITFVRPSFGPNARPGLEVVRITEIADKQGYVLERSRARFVPSAADETSFSDPVVLLRAPYRVSFSYAGRDKIWKNTWRDSDSLPSAVLMTVRDAATEQELPLSRIAVIHVNASADSNCDERQGECSGKPKAPADAAAPIDGATR